MVVLSVALAMLGACISESGYDTRTDDYTPMRVALGMSVVALGMFVLAYLT
jgi:hypothetical protein